jgi:hypothetical protein
MDPTIHLVADYLLAHVTPCKIAFVGELLAKPAHNWPVFFVNPIKLIYFVQLKQELTWLGLIWMQLVRNTPNVVGGFKEASLNVASNS